MSAPTFMVIWLLAVMGLYEVLFAIVSFLFLAPAPKASEVIELYRYTDNAEYLIRSALVRCRGRVYIVDYGAAEETLFIACALAEHERRIVLMPSGSLALSEDSAD